MKNYRFLVPVLLVVLFAGSLYMLYDTKGKTVKQYEEHLSAARHYRSYDIQVDAESKYKAALGIQPSIELSVEIGEFYRDAKRTKEAINWGHSITKEYPKQLEGYEFLIDLYAEKSDYVACFDIAETVQKRGLSSEKINSVIETMKYEFFYNGEYSAVGAYGNGLCPVLQGEYWGYINENGDKVVSSRFVDAGTFISGLASVVDTKGDVYYIDQSGNKKKVIKTVDYIERLGSTENGVFSVYDGESWNVYNESEELICADNEFVSNVGNAVIAVKNAGEWRLINFAGEDLTGKTYSDVVMDDKGLVYRNGRIFVCENGLYQMIDTAGVTYGNSFEAADVFKDGTYAAVKRNGKWGFVNNAGEEIISPQYEDARSFSNGFAAVKQDEKWGYINLQGEMVIEPQFIDVRDFTASGSALVLVGGDWRLLRLYQYNH